MTKSDQIISQISSINRGHRHFDQGLVCQGSAQTLIVLTSDVVNFIHCIFKKVATFT